MMDIKHPYIQGCVDVFINTDDSRIGSQRETIVIISELAESDLKSYLISYELDEKLVQEELIVRVALQMIYALIHLHELNIIHKDIKPANVLVFPGSVFKITDFGLSRYIENSFA